MKKSVLIIDGQRMVAEFLASFLERQFKGLTVIKTASMKEARLLLHHHRFDLVVTDIFGCENSGVTMITEIKRLSPNTRCLVLSAETNASWVDRALLAGAYGFVTKTCASTDVIKAVDAIMQGRRYLSSDVAQSFAEYFTHTQNGKLHSILSPREFEVFVQIGQGKSLKVISLDLNLSAKTVSVHKYNIGRKTGIDSSAKIARYCVENGLLRAAA